MWYTLYTKYLTAQKMKFSIQDSFSKCDKMHWKLRIWSHLLKKSLMENLWDFLGYFTQVFWDILHKGNVVDHLCAWE